MSVAFINKSGLGSNWLPVCCYFPAVTLRFSFLRDLGPLDCRELFRRCCILSFGWFPGVWILYAEVSEHSVYSFFIGLVFTRPTKKEQSVPKSQHIKFRRRDRPKERIQHSEHGERYKSRMVRRYCVTRCLNQIRVIYIVSGFYWRLLYRLTVICACLRPSFIKNVRYKNELFIYPGCLQETTRNTNTCLSQFWNSTEINSKRLSGNCTDGLNFSCNSHFSAFHFSNEVTLPSPSSSWDFFL